MVLRLPTFAASEGDRDILKLCFLKACDIEFRCEQMGLTLLHYAALRMSSDPALSAEMGQRMLLTITFLLDVGADPNPSVVGGEMLRGPRNAAKAMLLDSSPLSMVVEAWVAKGAQVLLEAAQRRGNGGIEMTEKERKADQS